LSATLSDFSIVSMATNAAHLRALRAPVSSLEKAMFGRLAKTAAVIETVTKDHGRYSAKMRETRGGDVEVLTPVKHRGRDGNDLKASL
jgi:hypothetical protein